VVKPGDTEHVIDPTATGHDQESYHSRQYLPQNTEKSLSYHVYTTSRKNRKIIQVMYGNSDKNKNKRRSH